MICLIPRCSVSVREINVFLTLNQQRTLELRAFRPCADGPYQPLMISRTSLEAAILKYAINQYVPSYCRYFIQNVCSDA